MSLRTFVKISTVTNLSDARYCAAMGVDMLGFSLDPLSENVLNSTTFQAITEWIVGVQVIGELDSIEISEIEELRSQYPIDGLQLSTTSDWKALKESGLTLICKVLWTEDHTFQHFQTLYQSIKPYVQYFLLESDSDRLTPEAGYHLMQVAEQYPILLGFDIRKDTILQLLSIIPLKGIALKGGHEIRPGYKDFDDLAEILEVLETE